MSVSFEIVKNIVSIDDGMSDMPIELNLVSWNNRKPKLDLRRWSRDHTSMSKGFTLSNDEAVKLFQSAGDVLRELLGDEETVDMSSDSELPFG